MFDNATFCVLNRIVETVSTEQSGMMKLEEQCPRQQANHAKQYSELPTEYSSLRIGRLSREGVDGRRIQGSTYARCG